MLRPTRLRISRDIGERRRIIDRIADRAMIAALNGALAADAGDLPDPIVTRAARNLLRMHKDGAA